MKKLATLLLTLLTCILISGCGSNRVIERLERQVTREEERANEYKTQVEELKAENDELRVELDASYINLEDYIDEIEYLEERLKNSSDSSSSNQDIIDELEKENKDLKNEVSSLKSQLTNSSDANLLATIEILNSQIASKNREINNLKTQLNAAKNNAYSTSNNATIVQLQNQINILTLDLQNYQTLAATLRQQLDAQIAINKNQSIQSAYSSYVAIKFWSDGKNYYTKRNVWYSDSYCSKKLSSQDIIITSPTIDRFEASNGYTVYCCMSNVGLVYTSSKPNLLEVK